LISRKLKLGSRSDRIVPSVATTMTTIPAAPMNLARRRIRRRFRAVAIHGGFDPAGDQARSQHLLLGLVPVVRIELELV